MSSQLFTPLLHLSISDEGLTEKIQAALICGTIQESPFRPGAKALQTVYVLI